MGIPINCKRLVEVDFPIVKVSDSSRREKDIKIGSFTTIHVWWARRPIAACRAMNLACMLPDPADKACPTNLRQVIALSLDQFEQSRSKGKISTKGMWEVKENGKLSVSRNRPKSLRKRLLNFIGEYSSWELKNSLNHTNCARQLIVGCNNEVAPLLADSFAGGGSIPLEAQRIGMKAFASDINPIPILLNRFQLEYLPSVTENDIKTYSKKVEEINKTLEEKIGHLFPTPISPNPNSGNPTGYLCARQVTCEGVNCGVIFPLLSSQWVSKKHKIAYTFSLEDELKVELISNPKVGQLPQQTCKKGDAYCPVCNHITPVKSVRRQLSSKQGGTNNSRLVAVVCQNRNKKGKIFRSPIQQEIEAREKASNTLNQLLLEYPNVEIPKDRMPPRGSLGMRVQAYGMTKWSDIFTHRQLCSQIVLSGEVQKIDDPIMRLVIAFSASKFTHLNTGLSMWSPKTAVNIGTFKSHRLQMAYDFYESIPFGNEGSNFINTFTNIIRGIPNTRHPPGAVIGQSVYSDATNHILPDDTVDLWATDPPYYDMVPYSDISNLFVVWLKQMIPDLVLENGIAPKSLELVMDKSSVGVQKKERYWYEESVAKALSEGHRITKPDGIAYWIYAHKSTEGWATVLKGLIDSGWSVTASWPLNTERRTRFRALKSASLSTSIHVIMRPRAENSGVGVWSVILQELPGTLNRWLTRMNKSGVVGADAIYSCIGPAMEMFSKYNSVERASGEEVSIDEYLQYVWDTVADEAVKLLSPDSEQSTAEPDARFSMMAIWTLRQSANVDYISGNTLDEEEIEVAAEPSKLTIPFDTASLLARGIGAVIEDLEKNEVIDVKGSNVKILSPEDRRHYLLGVTNGGSKVQQKASGGIQMKLGESSEEAEVRVDIETKQKGLIEMPKRESQLDKLHQAMLLHGDGNSVALEAHLRDNIGDDPTVWQLANTLNTLFPEGSWERSKIEGVIARYQSLR